MCLRPGKKPVARCTSTGTCRSVINRLDTLPLKVRTLYYPPKHLDGAAHKTKAEAEAADAVEHNQGGLAVGVHTQ